MRKELLLATAVILVLLSFSAVMAYRGTAGSVQTDFRPDSLGSGLELTLSSATADRIAEEAPATDEEEHHAISLFSGDGDLSWTSGGLDELIEELIASGDLSEAGAEKLRESLKGRHLFGIRAPGTWKDGEHAFGNQFFFAPDGEGAIGHAPFFLHKGLGQGHFNWRTEDDGKVLEISIGDDGEITVEGEGYTEEELSEIREKIRQNKAEGKPWTSLDIPGAPNVLTWENDGEHAFSFTIPEFEGRSWFDGDGELGLKKFYEQLPGDGQQLFAPGDPLVAPHMFMFREHDGEFKDEIREMVREILKELGIEPGEYKDVESTSA